jgi:hypothetical protein
MKRLVMTWNTEDGRLACRWRMLEREGAETVSIPRTRSDEPRKGTFVAAGMSDPNGEVSHAA